MNFTWMNLLSPNQNLKLDIEERCCKHCLLWRLCNRASAATKLTLQAGVVKHNFFRPLAFYFFFLNCTKYPSEYSSFKTLSLGLSYFLNFNRCHCLLCATGVCGNKIYFTGRCSQTQPFQASCFLFFFLKCTKYPSKYSSFKILSLGLSYFLNFNQYHCILPPSLSKT